MITKINRSFTWYEVRPASGYSSFCKGTKYQFTEHEALLFMQELKENPKHAGEELQIVKVRHAEKTTHPK